MRSDKRVCVVSSTRADYGLLSPLLKKIKNDRKLNLDLVVTGMHLSNEFGLTIKEIKQDGFEIEEEIEILLNSDTETSIAKSMGLASLSFSELFTRVKPNLLILLGDRYEIFTIASIATIFKIPIAHISGGDVTEGAYDDAFRHSITKMSYLHFTTTERYMRRVIQLGENPSRVFNVGNLGVENVDKLNFINRQDLFKKLNLMYKKPVITVIFHPTTLDKMSPKKQMKNILKATKNFDDYQFVFIKGNSDTNGLSLNYFLEKCIKKMGSNYKLYSSLDHLTYLSLLKQSTIIIGNSSSGIVEAPSLGLGTINIGDRQKGRVKAESIIDCEPQKSDIVNAINKISSKEFQDKILKSKNPYKNNNTSKKILKIIKKFLYESEIDLKKAFYDIKVDL